MIKCFFDKDGGRHVDHVDLPSIIAGFLLLDVQDSTSYCEEVILFAERVQAGNLHSWEDAGNAYRIDMSEKGVFLTNVWTEEQGFLSLAQFLDSIRVYLEFLNGRD